MNIDLKKLGTLSLINMLDIIEELLRLPVGSVVDATPEEMQSDYDRITAELKRRGIDF